MLPRILNVGLRGSGMIGKFLLILLLARVLPPEDIGTFGLIAATIGYALYLLGLDFYTYSSRVMLQANRTMWPTMLRDQAALFACSYVVILPLFGLVFLTGVLPLHYALVIYLLLITEHLSQELVRLLVVVGKPLAAGISMFVRSGAWCYALIAVSFSGIELDLERVLWAWVLADAVTLAGGIWLFRDLHWSARAREIDWAWIGRGLRVSVFLLAGALALRGPFTLDRYFIEAFATRELLGVYTLYLGICLSLTGFVDAAVFSFRYPRLVSLYKSGDIRAFDDARRDFRRQTLIAVFILALAAALLVVPVLEWTGRQVYLQHLPVFYVLLVASIFFVISHIPHYSLYAMGEDRAIVAAHFAGFGSFAILGFVLTRSHGLAGVAIALLIAMVSVAVVKQWRLISIDRSLVRDV